MIWPLVTMGRITHVNAAAIQQQSRTLILKQRIEFRCRYGYGTLRHIRSGGNVELMQPLFKVPGGFCKRDHIKNTTYRINDGGSDDAHIAVDIQAAKVIIPYARRCAEVYMPDRLDCLRVVSIESVNAIVHSRYEDKVMISAADEDIRKNEWLAVNLIVSAMLEEDAKRFFVYLVGRQNGFAKIGPGARQVVVLHQHIYLRECPQVEKEYDDESGQQKSR